MGVLAAAPAALLDALATALGPEPRFTLLRPAEIGLVMVRGRQGGDGAPFNLGEMTLTRCAVRLDCGTIGQAFIAGRDKAKAQRAALIDALLQREAAAGADGTTEPDGPVARGVLLPLRKAAAAERDQRLRKAAATKVEFFGLVRMG